MSALAMTPDVSRTYGAAMIGLLVSSFLSGITTMQTHLYFQTASQDRLFLKVAVTTLWIIDMAHLGIISAFVYHYVVSNWGNLEIIHHSTWTLGLEEMLNSWITFIVQMVFIRRILVFDNHNWWTLSPLYILAALQLAFGTGGGIRSLFPQTVGHLASTRWRAAIWLISGAINDILIATILCYHLWNQRTGLSKRLVDQLLAYTINTGLLTSILAFVDIGCFIAMPNNYIHLAFNFVLGRLYANSLLASLNMRRHIRQTSRVFQMSSVVATENTSISDPVIVGLSESQAITNALPIGQGTLAADDAKICLGRSTDRSHPGMQSASGSELNFNTEVV